MPVAELFDAAAAGEVKRLGKEFKKVKEALYPDAWQRLAEGRPVGEGLVTVPGLGVGGVTSKKQQVKMVLAALMDPETGLTIGTLAASQGKSNVLRWLKDKGIATHFPDRTGRCPIHVAAARGDMESARDLMKNYYSRIVTDSHGCTALHIAARHGHVRMVTELCESDHSVNARDLEGKTPAHHAAEGGRPDIVRRLERWGADLAAEDGTGRTCGNILEEQSRARHVAAIAAPGTDLPWSIPQGAVVPRPAGDRDPLERNPDGRTAAHTAIERGDIASLERLHQSRNLQEAFPNGEIARFALRQPESQHVVA